MLKKAVMVAVGGCLAFIASAETYERVAYIESTGTQWIDTGVIANARRTRYEAHFMVLEAPSAEVGLFGGAYTSLNPVSGSYVETAALDHNKQSSCAVINATTFKPKLVFGSGSGYEASYTARTQYALRPKQSAMVVLHAPNNVSTSLGHDSYVKTMNDTDVCNAYIGNVNIVHKVGEANGELLTASGSMAKIRWYAFRIFRDEELVADFLPVRRNDGVYGFYETLTEAFFPSEGEDAFVGPTYADWRDSDATAISDVSHWSVTPTADTVLRIPANKSVAATTSEEVTFLNGTAGLELADPSAEFAFSNLTTTVTVTGPLFGRGTVRNVGSSSSVQLATDNSMFDGTFAVSNGATRLKHWWGLGQTNRVDVYEDGSSRIFYLDTVSSWQTKNNWHIQRAYNSSQNANFSLLASGVTFQGEVHLYNGEIWFVNSGQNCTFTGPVVSHGSGTVRFVANVTINGEEKEFGLNAMAVKGASGRVGAAIHTTAKVADRSKSPATWMNFGLGNGSNTASPMKFAFDVANAFDEDAGFLFRYGAGSDGNTETGVLDLNGLDQRVGRLGTYICQTDQFAGTQDWSDMKISSPVGKPAMLTVGDTCQFGHGATETGNKKQWANTFPGSICGSASLTLATLETIEAPGRIIFRSAKSDTDGALIARRGTIVIESTAAFSNLSSVVVSGSGLMKVETADVGNANEDFFVCVSNAESSARLEIVDGVTLKARTSCMNGVWLDAGLYSSAASEGVKACKWLAGDGILDVAEYGGPKGMILIFR